MLNYKNLSGKSNVVRFEIGPSFIVVEFTDGRERFYKYSYSSAGQNNVEYMKSLAIQGEGLNSFIMLNVKNNYEPKMVIDVQ